jgi:hypothetical protein
MGCELEKIVSALPETPILGLNWQTLSVAYSCAKEPGIVLRCGENKPLILHWFDSCPYLGIIPGFFVGSVRLIVISLTRERG